MSDQALVVFVVGILIGALVVELAHHRGALPVADDDAPKIVIW